MRVCRLPNQLHFCSFACLFMYMCAVVDFYAVLLFDVSNV